MASSEDPDARLLLDATAGAVGSLFTCCLLYPVDKAKIRIQAGRSKASVLQTMREIAHERALELLTGLPAKAVHTTVQNFIYFYAYEWYKAVWRNTLGFRVSTMGNTICGVAAGVTNLSFTLPLETLSVRMQAESGRGGRSVGTLSRELLAEGRAGLWRGYGVSCVLALNPALTVAVFDVLKLRWLKLLSAGRSAKVSSLSVAQAFLLGSLAKVIATLVTYPLIRTKTVMQAQRPGEAGARRGMANVLVRIARDEGLGGLYRGVYAQIFTAVSKSGLLLTTKEQVAVFAMSLVLLVRRRKSRKSLS